MLSAAQSRETQLSQVATPLLGTFAVAVVILAVCKIVGYEQGVPVAVILTALSSGILSSAAYEKVAAKNKHPINKLFLVLNGLLSAAVVYLLLAWLVW